MTKVPRYPGSSAARRKAPPSLATHLGVWVDGGIVRVSFAELKRDHPEVFS